MIVIDDLSQLLAKHPTRKWATRRQAEITDVVVHQAFSTDTIHQLANYYVSPGNHVDNLGCPSFPYTFAIEITGLVYQCNPLEAMTYQLGDSTWRGDLERSFVSICFLGNFGDSRPRPSQIAAFIDLLGHLQSTLATPIRPIGVHGHCHWGKACCPGAWVAEFIETMRKDQVRDISVPFRDRLEVTKYQRENGLPVTGVADYTTLRYLTKP